MYGPGGGADGGGAKDGGLCGALAKDADAVARCILGGPLNPWLDGGPGRYGVEVDWGTYAACKGFAYWMACCSCIAALLRPVPSAASGGGGVFSR